jgi:hypothetical protein
MDERSIHLPPCAVVVREGSELAERLQGEGWSVRGGWRATDSREQLLWYLRYESPAAAIAPPVSMRCCGTA